MRPLFTPTSKKFQDQNALVDENSKPTSSSLVPVLPIEKNFLLAYCEELEEWYPNFFGILRWALWLLNTLINGVFDVRHFISTHVETKHTDGIKLIVNWKYDEMKKKLKIILKQFIDCMNKPNKSHSGGWTQRPLDWVLGLNIFGGWNCLKSSEGSTKLFI